MNLKTTFALLLLAAAGGGLLVLAHRPFTTPVSTAGPGDDPRTVLSGLYTDQLRRLEIQSGKQSTILESSDGTTWVMPGNWPTRAAEVRGLVDLLVHLHSRFQPEAMTDTTRQKTGLDKPAVTVVLNSVSATHTLKFAEEPSSEANRFERPTWVQVDDHPEAWRLAPGLVSVLERPADYYQQRRLFPAERVARGDSSTEKVERLNAQEVVVTAKDQPSFTLARVESDWELREPTRDRLAPSVRDSLLEAVPELWAERFVTTGKPTPEDLKKYGLLEPEKVLSVTPANGKPLVLEIGAVVESSSAPTPGSRPRSYARIRDFDRVFEVNTDKLSAIFVSLDSLRDDLVARFQPEDVRRVEIRQGGQVVVLRNETPREPERPASGPPPVPPPPVWKLEQPLAASADVNLVQDLVSKLSNLPARDKDVLSRTRLKAVSALVGLPALPGPGLVLAGPLADLDGIEKELGLAKPAASVKLTIEEKDKTDRSRFNTRTLTLDLGRRDPEAKKLFVRTEGWPRVNEVEDSVADLVLGKKPIDYRGRKLFDFAAENVETVTVRQIDQPALGSGLLSLLGAPQGPAWLAAVAALAHDRSDVLTLKSEKGTWKLTSPVATDADSERARTLAEQLGRLEVAQYVAEDATPRELAEVYGLALPHWTIQFTVKKKDKKAVAPALPASLAEQSAWTLEVGARRGTQPGYYARVAGSPEILALSDDVVRTLGRDSLAYRPTRLWPALAKDDITDFRIHKAGQEEYRLLRKGEGWEVTGPFTVSAPAAVVDRLVKALSEPRCLTYRAHEAPDLAPFGLDKPAVRVTVTSKDNPSHTLLVGAETPDGLGRFGKLASGPGVFVIEDSLAQAADQSALDFLDRSLWTFDPAEITGFRRQKGADQVELARKDGWQLTKPAEQPGDERKITGLLQKLAGLQAQRIVAYPAKDLGPFGLDKPDATVTLLAGEDKPTERVLLLGRVVDEAQGDRYALVKGTAKVGILAGSTVKALLAGPLAFADHQVARFRDADRILLEQGARKATFSKVEGSWKMVKPLDTEVEHEALEAFLDGLYRLRADELVMEKPSEADLKKVGLDRPVMKWKIFNGDKEELELLVGAAESTPGGESAPGPGPGPGGVPRRYARVAGKDLVFLLDPKVSAAAVSEYRPRSIWKEPFDPVQIETVRFGYKEKPFELRKGEDGSWQVVGRPDVKLDAKLVNDTLALLRDPRLEHYAVDQGADLALFGLKPPELVLEATTPSGKRVLHVGGLEGKSQRRYAHRPDSGRTDVLLLSAADSTRLFRQLADFSRRAE
jgi:hypothetical protein